MNLLLVGAIVVVGALLFVFYGMKREEEKNENMTRQVRFSRNLLNEYWLDIIEYVTTGYLDKASGLLKELIRKNPDEYPAYLVLSYILRKQGKVEKALNVDKTIFAGMSTISRRGKKAIQKSLLIDYVENGMLKTALKTMEESFKDIENDELVLSLGRDISYKLGEFEKALYYTEKMLGLKKTKDRSELGYIAADLAKDALHKGDTVTAGKLLKQGRHHDSGSARLLFVESYLRYAEGAKGKARETFMKALNMSPGSVYHVRDRMYEIFEEDHAKMAKSLRPIVAANTQNAALHVFLAHELRALGRYDEAAEEYLEAILYEPESRHILFLMLDLYIETGNWDKVREIRDELKGVDGEVAYVCSQCGAPFSEPVWYCDKCGTWGGVTVRL